MAGLRDSLLTCGFWGERGWRSVPCPQLRSSRVQPRSGPSSLLTGTEPAWLELSGCPPAPTTRAPVLCSPLQASGCLQALGQASLWGPGTCSSDCKAGSSGKGEGGGRDTAGRPGACLWESESHTEAGGSPGLRPPDAAPHTICGQAPADGARSFPGPASASIHSPWGRPPGGRWGPGTVCTC